jgi:formylmethanofuran dehydrogenase subunit A
MLIELANAHIIDPTHPQHGHMASLFIEDGQFVPLEANRKPNQRIDVEQQLVMAGAIDIHTHIGGGKVNLSRLLMADVFQSEQRVVWPTLETGAKYCRMGYTACFEPAMLLSGARHTHLELADTPLLDSGAYVLLGNEDWLLKALGQNVGDEQLRAMVAWSVRASQAMAVKVVNPGGINAFKFNQRKLDVDQAHVQWGVTPRDVVRRLTAAVDDLGLAHPLHVHASNLGVPGNIASTLQTLDSSEGRRIHLTHAQFNCYSSSGPYGMGSGAEQLAKYVNSHPNVTLDVGQVLFGQTVTISADTAAQYGNRQHAKPARWYINDVECQAGCGVIPIRYENRQYVHSLQWTIGLELMLLINDPWRVFLTTDHPNGGPFTCYPHLMRLLMDKSFRQTMLEQIHPQAANHSLLREIDREYSLAEIAITTRAAPARILGLERHGTLCDGAVADLAIYRQQSNWEDTFAQATCVMKGGVQVVRDGQLLHSATPCTTHKAHVDCDPDLITYFRASVEQSLRMPLSALMISDDELSELIRRDRRLQAGPSAEGEK